MKKQSSPQISQITQIILKKIFLMKNFQISTLAILASLLVSSSGVWAGVSAELSIASEQDARAFPYRSAILKIQNNTSKEFSTVRIRWKQGGPTFIYPVVILPNAETPLSVSLPAVSLAANYDITLTARDTHGAKVLETLTARINWPMDMLTTNEFINPTIYEKYGGTLPSWPGELKLKIFLSIAAGVIVFVAILLIPRPVIRAAMMIPAVLCLTFFLVSMLSKKNTPIVHVQEQGNLKIITCRRTCNIAWGKLPTGLGKNWKLIGKSNQTIPIYQAIWQMREDDMIIHPNQFATLKLRPNEVRIFRKFVSP